MATTIAAITVTAVAALAGCTPAPVPTPTPTAAFASEEEAFAAAEEVYRAYNDALNAARISEEPDGARAYLTGRALESDLEAKRYLDAENLRLVGEGVIDGFEGESATLEKDVTSITVHLCLDVSQTHVEDAAGIDVTPTDRQARLPLEVTFVGSSEALLISSSDLIEGEEC